MKKTADGELELAQLLDNQNAEELRTWEKKRTEAELANFVLKRLESIGGTDLL